MSILSLSFLLFLLILVAMYYLLPGRCSPYVILLGNVYFYLQFGYRHGVFLLLSVLLTFFGALLIQRAPTPRYKKLVLWAVLVLNIGFLFFVKFTPYLLGLLAVDAGGLAEHILVPVGVSFYTLQVTGYCIDVYRGKYPAQRNLLKYAAFGTFFPLMLQGPISRYDQLSTTLFQPCRRGAFYKNLTSGSQLMLWGFFKKLVIADRAAMLVNTVFENYPSYAGSAILVAALCYTLQIYADFSGCVDICRGAAELFGIRVMDNFKQPYFAVSIQDFWRRWHIALSSWLRDYVYFPLGGNRKGTVRKYLNLLIVFFVSGLWHGVGIHYLVWGLLQGVLQIVGALTLSLRQTACRLLRINRESEGYIWVRRLFTLGLVTFSWVIFRATGTIAAVRMLRSVWLPSTGASLGLDLLDWAILLAGVLVLLVVSHYREKGCSIRGAVAATPIPVRWSAYLALFLAVLVFGIYGPGFSESAFIYMSF